MLLRYNNRHSIAEAAIYRLVTRITRFQS